MAFVTVKNVALAKVGDYDLSTGSHTFTQQNLDSSAKNPFRARLGIGHTDERYNKIAAKGDADLCFGQIENKVVRGDTIYGDFVNVDENLARMIPSSLPGRSIEATVYPNGDMRIDAVKLLGVTLPGVTDLPDIKSLVSESPGVFVAASADSDGRPVTVVLDNTTTLSASSETNDPKKGSETMDPKLRASLIALHGLAEDATDKQINDAVAKAATDAAAAAKKTKDDEAAAKADAAAAKKADDADEDDDEGDLDDISTAEAVAVLASRGIHVMSKKDVDTLTIAASAGVAARDQQLKEDKVKVMNGHLDRGAVTPDSVKEIWLGEYDENPEKCKKLMASLPSNVVPVELRGEVGEDAVTIAASADTNKKSDEGTGWFDFEDEKTKEVA